LTSMWASIASGPKPQAAEAAVSEDVSPFADGAANRVLVVDAGPLIKGARLETLGSTFWTIQEVLNEVRDKKARLVMEALPYTIETRVPSEEAMKAVVDFSKKTGDFRALSVVDLKVMALAWQLEKEYRGGVDHLRTEPEASQAKVTKQHSGSMPGWHFVGKKPSQKGNTTAAPAWGAPETMPRIWLPRIVPRQRALRQREWMKKRSRRRLSKQGSLAAQHRWGWHRYLPQGRKMPWSGRTTTMMATGG